MSQTSRPNSARAQNRDARIGPARPLPYLPQAGKDQLVEVKEKAPYNADRPPEWLGLLTEAMAATRADMSRAMKEISFLQKDITHKIDDVKAEVTHCATVQSSQLQLMQSTVDAATGSVQQRTADVDSMLLQHRIDLDLVIRTVQQCKHEVESAIRESQTATESLIARSVVDLDPVLEGLQQSKSEVLHALQEGRLEDSERIKAAIDDGKAEVCSMIHRSAVDLKPLCDTMRNNKADFDSAISATGSDLEKILTAVQENGSMIRQNVVDLQPVVDAITESKSGVDASLCQCKMELESLVRQSTVDLDPILSFIQQSKTEINAKIMQTSVDLDPVLRLIQETKMDVDALIRQNAVDLDPVLRSIQQSRAEADALIRQNIVDLTPVLTSVQQNRTEISALIRQTAIDLNPVLGLVQQSKTEIESLIRQHIVDLDPVVTSIPQNKSAMERLIQQQTTDLQAVLSTIQQNKSEIGFLIQKHATDLDPLIKEVQHIQRGVLEAENLVQLGHSDLKGISCMIQEGRIEMGKLFQANAINLEPVIRTIEQSKTVVDFEPVMFAIQRQINDTNNAISTIVQAVHDSKTDVDWPSIQNGIQQNSEMCNKVISRINALSGESQTNLARILQAVDFAPISETVQRSKDPIIDEVRKLKQNFSVKIDLSPILSAIAEVHDKLAASLKSRG